MLAMLLAVTMLPAAGLSPAFADEPAPRPATSGGDVALESTNADAGAEAQAPVAEARQDGMLAADGLLYTVADGGLSLAGFDGDAPEGALAVPAAVSVDGKDTPVVAVDIAEGQVADKVVTLSLPQNIKDIDTATLAPAFPALLSVEVAAAAGSPLPAASGAASMRAAYSTSGGMLFRPTSVTMQVEDGSIETIECKELVWAPPAIVSARVPVECRAIAEGAFADARELKTVVAFGTMERIADGAFSTDQMESAKVVTPASSPAVADEGSERVSASMALMGDAGQKERRYAWHEAGWRTDDIVMGKPYGSLTETVAVAEDGSAERSEAMLVSYPGAHENAMDLKKPNEDGVIEQAENGLAFTVKSDMTASVAWKGDPTATPAHIDIPSSVVIDGVTYPVTEIAPNAFKGAVFLTSVDIPESVNEVVASAFEDCVNLPDADKLVSPPMMQADSNSAASQEQAIMSEGTMANDNAQTGQVASDETADHLDEDGTISSYATSSQTLYIDKVEGLAGVSISDKFSPYATVGTDDGCWTLTTKGGANYFGFDMLYPLSSQGVKMRPITSSGTTTGAPYGHYLELTAASGYRVVGFMLGSDAERATTSDGYTWYPETGSVNLYPIVEQGSSIDLSSYATQKWVTDKNYATQTWVTGKGYITKSVSNLDNYYTKTTADKTFATKSELAGKADSSHTHSNYLTSGSLNGYLKTADADERYQTAGSYAAANHNHDGTYAAASHNHDGTYAKKTDLNSYVTNKTAADTYATKQSLSSYVTNSALSTTLGTYAKKTDIPSLSGYATQTWASGQFPAKSSVYTKAEADGRYVAASEFGTITYAGLDASDKSVYPTSYRKGGMPSLPAPQRDGYDFAGWSWSRGGTQGTASNLASAFSEAGAVELVATWNKIETGIPEANHFFSSDLPLDATSADTQTWVIKVRLSDSPKAVSHLRFKPKDVTSLIDATKLGDKVFCVGTTEGVLDNGAWTFWDGEISERIALVDVGDGYGLYVGISIPAGAINADNVVKSFSGGDYIASLVTLEYTFE